MVFFQNLFWGVLEIFFSLFDTFCFVRSRGRSEIDEDACVLIIWSNVKFTQSHYSDCVRGRRSDHKMVSFVQLSEFSFTSFIWTAREWGVNWFLVSLAWLMLERRTELAWDSIWVFWFFILNACFSRSMTTQAIKYAMWHRICIDFALDIAFCPEFSDVRQSQSVTQNPIQRRLTYFPANEWQLFLLNI